MGYTVELTEQETELMFEYEQERIHAVEDENREPNDWKYE